MIICCAVPLVIIGFLTSIGIPGSWGYYTIFLLCPLLHVFMMRGHSSLHGNGNDQAGIEKDAVKNYFGEK